jgi:hypothetical protein
MLIITAVTVTGTPNAAHRSSAARTVRQFPGPGTRRVLPLGQEVQRQLDAVESA